MMNGFELRPISVDVARKMIVKNHYSHTWTMCDVVLGVFQHKGRHSFFEGTTDDKLIGCLVYGNPVGRQVHRSISPMVKHREILELTRLWIEDGTPKNLESWVISRSFEWLKIHRPKIKVLISYADPVAGHFGKIYQATNWIYQHIDRGKTPRISFSEPPNCKWLHPRNVVSMYGTRNMKEMQKKLPRPFWVKLDPTKFRYLYPIWGNKIWKKKFIKSLIHPPSEYPKELLVDSKIDCYKKIENSEEELFSVFFSDEEE